MPRPTRLNGSPPWLILHLFSGQRRPHDFQHEFEFLTAISGLPVLCISIDLALDPDRCDLSRASAIALWKQAVLDGRALAVVAGPP